MPFGLPCSRESQQANSNTLEPGSSIVQNKFHGGTHAHYWSSFPPLPECKNRNTSASLPLISNIPETHQHYVPRPKYEDQVIFPPDKGCVCTLRGLSGTGKSQIAFSVMNRLKDKYKIVYYFVASLIVSKKQVLLRRDIRSDLEILGKKINSKIPYLRSRKRKGCLSSLKARFRSLEDRAQDSLKLLQKLPSAQALLLFDGVRSYDDIARWIPEKQHILITTTYQNLGCSGESLSINIESTEKEHLSVEILRSYCGTEEGESASLEKLADLLGHLPLALAQAGSYIMAHPSINVEHYISRYEKRLKILRHAEENTPRPKIAHAAAYITFELNFNAAREKNRNTALVLNLCAFCTPNGIKYSMLKEALKLDETVFHEALDILINYSLITSDRLNQAISIHCVPQTVKRSLCYAASNFDAPRALAGWFFSRGNSSPSIFTYNWNIIQSEHQIYYREQAKSLVRYFITEMGDNNTKQAFYQITNITNILYLLGLYSLYEEHDLEQASEYLKYADCIIDARQDEPELAAKIKIKYSKCLEWGGGGNRNRTEIARLRSEASQLDESLVAQIELDKINTAIEQIREIGHVLDRLRQLEELAEAVQGLCGKISTPNLKVMGLQKLLLIMSIYIKDSDRQVQFTEKCLDADASDLASAERELESREELVDDLESEISELEHELYELPNWQTIKADKIKNLILSKEEIRKNTKLGIGKWNKQVKKHKLYNDLIANQQNFIDELTQNTELLLKIAGQSGNAIHPRIKFYIYSTVRRTTEDERIRARCIEESMKCFDYLPEKDKVMVLKSRIDIYRERGGFAPEIGQYLIGYCTKLKPGKNRTQIIRLIEDLLSRCSRKKTRKAKRRRTGSSLSSRSSLLSMSSSQSSSTSTTAAGSFSVPASSSISSSAALLLSSSSSFSSSAMSSSSVSSASLFSSTRQEKEQEKTKSRVSASSSARTLAVAVSEASSNPLMTESEFNKLVLAWIVADTAANSAVRAARETLQKRAEDLGYNFHKIPMDGNCFFHAVADQLQRLGRTGRDMDAATLRAIVAAEVSSHFEHYEAFISQEERANFARNMAKPGHWVGQIATLAIARSKKINIVVIPHNGVPQVTPGPGATQYIVLGNEVDFHFWSLVPKTGKVGTLTKDLTTALGQRQESGKEIETEKTNNSRQASASSRP